MELLHISSNCSALPKPGTHVEHGKRCLFLGRNRGCCDLAYKEKRRHRGGEDEPEEEEKGLRRRHSIISDFSEGQRSDGLVCTTLWHNNVLH